MTLQALVVGGSYPKSVFGKDGGQCDHDVYMPDKPNKYHEGREVYPQNLWTPALDCISDQLSSAKV